MKSYVMSFNRYVFLIVSLLLACIANSVWADNQTELFSEKLNRLQVLSKSDGLSFIYFGDVGCGYCRKYLKKMQPKLKAQYFSVDVELADRFTELEFSYLLGSFASSELATKHLICAEQFSNTSDDQVMKLGSLNSQLKEKIISVPEKEVLEKLPSFIKQLGIDKQAMQQCVESKETQLALQKGNDLGNRIGLQSIPQFFIGYQKDGQWLEVETLVGLQPYSVFEKKLERIKTFTQRYQSGSKKELAKDGSSHGFSQDSL